MDVVNLQISKRAGLTKFRQARGLGVSMGIARTPEDWWGGDVTTAAIAHLAHTTPEDFRFPGMDFNRYETVSTAESAPPRVDGSMTAGNAPGRGIPQGIHVAGSPVILAR